jgi:hypothetical protein
MLLENFKNDMRQLIAEGNTPSVFQRLEAGIVSKSAFFNMIFTRKCNFNMLENEHLGGILSDEDFRTEKNKTHAALLTILDKLTEADLQPVQNDFERAVGALEIPQGSLGKAFLVNLDRNRPYKQFYRFFQNEKDKPFQFHFIVGCPTQSPDGFAERLVYEIIENFATESSEAVDFDAEKRALFGNEVERAILTRLPIGGSLEASQAKFKKYFAGRIQKFNLPEMTIEDFVQLKKTQLPFKYMIFNFEINAKDWSDDPEVTRYLRWLIETFKPNDGGQPSFLFFFVVNMRNAFQQEDPSVMAEIDSINAAFEQVCHLTIKDLQPVAVEDVESWLLESVNPDKPENINKLLTQASKEWSAKGWTGGEAVSMMYLKDLQAAVYVSSLKK